MSSKPPLANQASSLSFSCIDHAASSSPKRELRGALWSYYAYLRTGVCPICHIDMSEHRMLLHCVCIVPKQFSLAPVTISSLLMRRCRPSANASAGLRPSRAHRAKTLAKRALARGHAASGQGACVIFAPTCAEVYAVNPSHAFFSC